MVEDKILWHKAVKLDIVVQIILTICYAVKSSLYSTIINYVFTLSYCLAYIERKC